MARTSLAALELLVAVDVHGSISAASRALGLAQPTVSAGIRRLELATGLKLVDRSPRGSTLTDHGTTTAAWARDVLAASDRFERSTAQLRDAGETRLVVAASMTIAEHLVPTWLASWRRTSDAIESSRPAVELLVRNSVDVAAQVRSGEADLGFIEGPDVAAELVAKVVARDELVAVVSPQHPRALERRPMSAAEFAHAQVVLREQGSGTRAVFEQALRNAGVKLRDDLPQLGSTAAVKSAVRQGDALAVVSILAVRDDLAAGTLIRIPTIGLDLRRDFQMIWRGPGLPTGAARDFAEVVGR